MKVKKTDSGEIYDVQSIDFYVSYKIKFNSRNKWINKNRKVKIKFEWFKQWKDFYNSASQNMISNKWEF